MRNRIVTSAIAALFVLSFVPIVHAGDQGTGCPTDPERVRFYENNIGDTSDGNDTIIFCGLGASDLSLIPHTLAGGCKDGIKFQDDWNDCISSMYPVVPVNRVLCLYGNSNFSGVSVHVLHDDTINDMRSNLGSGSGLNDGLSSWHFIDWDEWHVYGC